ncbi:MAG: DUF4230 domain-containing protein [Oscillospiraceae bacterium]|nr:DUF4230 domain-containing protein [Oscillospiraceae bacterium]
MKKIIQNLPLIVFAAVLVLMIVLFATGAFDAPKETLITTSTLTEVIKTAKLSTAKYVQHGVAKAHIEGTKDGYVLYYAVVKPNINLEDIDYEIDDNSKVVTVILPDKFSFEIELLQDEEHKFYYYPDEKDDWTGKDVTYICKTDARAKAEANAELITSARKNLENTIKSLLDPLLASDEWTLVFSTAAVQGE